jgi:UDP:flavonoid glycosyltransferase YjiC (YdhE family)
MMSNIGLTIDGAVPKAELATRAGPRRKRILFLAEALTLAQVVRLLALARRLDPERYEVHFACGPFDAIAFEGTGITPIPLFTVDRAAALKKIDRGDRLYEKDVLGRYVEDELALFDRLKPDLVVGDFRLSLAVSAPRAGIPHATLINAYFSPYAEHAGFPVPDHPLVSLLGAKRAAEYFPRALPLVFAHFVAPLDAVRKRYGLPPSGGLLQALTAGDFTLYPDVPELCPTRNAPSTHRYLGPVPWSPELPLPDFFADFEADVPLVYVTLGSSGRYAGLEAVLRVIGEFPVQALVATAGRFELDDVPPNVRVARYVPGALVARASRFVITNGGASTSYQALAEGKPVLGVPSNLDQYLAMTAIERASAGRLVRSGEATPGSVRAAFTELLTSNALRSGAERVASAFAAADCHQNFDALLSQVFGTDKKERSA